MSRPLHPCAVSTCSNLVSKGPRCPTHAIPRKQSQPRDAKTQAFYDSPMWRHLRTVVRKQQPICMVCKRLPSHSVDHINGKLADNRMENLQALCRRCHDKKSGREVSDAFRVASGLVGQVPPIVYCAVPVVS